MRGKGCSFSVVTGVVRAAISVLNCLLSLICVSHFLYSSMTGAFSVNSVLYQFTDLDHIINTKCATCRARDVLPFCKPLPCVCSFVVYDADTSFIVG